MKDCAVCNFKRSFTIMAVPASYTPFTILFLAFDIYATTMGTIRRSSLSDMFEMLNATLLVRKTLKNVYEIHEKTPLDVKGVA